MKKTNSMRVATIMLALTLITSCFVGGTFAKYITNVSSSDNARVAKFGVTVDVGEEIFKAAYDKTEALQTDAGFDLGVESANGTDKVVAPGTSGSMKLFTIDGTPEVAVRINAELKNVQSVWLKPINAFEKYMEIVITETKQEMVNRTGNGYEKSGDPSTVIKRSKSVKEVISADQFTKRPTRGETTRSEREKFEIIEGTAYATQIKIVEEETPMYDPVYDENIYYPIKWTLKKDGTNVVTEGTLADVQAYIEENIDEKVFAPNTDLAEEIGGTYTLEWKWKFYVDKTKDIYDTALGNIAAGMTGIYLEEEFNITEAFDFSITVTQID